MGILETITDSPTRKTVGGFFSTKLYTGKFFELDGWLFMHFLFGGIVMFILNKLKLKKVCKYCLFLSILVIYEIIEFFLYTSLLTTIFLPETKINILWDLFFGIGGAFLYEWKIKKQKETL